MRRLLVAGATCTVIGLLGTLINFWAREQFPDHWGGPNIGGGLLQLLFYALIVAGLAIVVVAAVVGRSRSDGPTGAR
jgi:hypothetical protein